MTSANYKTFPKSVLIYNPRSGSALDRDLWLGTIVDKLCNSLQHKVLVSATTAGTSAADILEELISISPELIIAAGGDGTIRHILGSLAETKIKIPVALIPFGTGNQLARNLRILEENIFQDPLQHAIDVIAAAKPRLIDLGKVNGNFFCVGVGVGPICEAILAPTQEEKENWGMLAYVGPMIRTITSPAVSFKVTADGDTFEVKALAVIVANVGDMGFARISEAARLDDGCLDLCIMTLSEFGDYVKLGFDVASSIVLGDTPFYVRKVKKVRIESLNGPVVANVDGDSLGETPIDIEVFPSAVNILCPK
ncbi:MAG TPA: diacylglycerol kinase family protein [Oculatellaceae cyanobacterium]